MALPLFDDVLVDALAPAPDSGPRGESREAFERDRFGETGDRPFELDDHRPKSHRPATVARYGSPCYFAFWQAFNKGKDGQSPPGREHDEDINRYVQDGYRLGKLVGWKPPKER